MKTKLILGCLGLLAFQTAAFAAEDSCDDYFQRHFKADIVPIGAYVDSVPNQGDIAGGEFLNVRIKNQGNQPIQGPQGGILAANALTVSVRPAGRIVFGPHFRPAQVYQTFLNAPLAPGATTTVSMRIPTGSIGNCAKMRIQIDVRHTAKQHGCACYGNDAATFTIQKKGSFLNCLALVLPNP